MLLAKLFNNEISDSDQVRSFSRSSKRKKPQKSSFLTMGIIKDDFMFWLLNASRNWGSASNVDRKSTRLNSSHVRISYAVFCLKKKNKKKHQTTQRQNTNKTHQYKNQINNTD